MGVCLPHTHTQQNKTKIKKIESRERRADSGLVGLSTPYTSKNRRHSREISSESSPKLNDVNNYTADFLNKKFGTIEERSPTSITIPTPSFSRPVPHGVDSPKSDRSSDTLATPPARSFDSSSDEDADVEALLSGAVWFLCVYFKYTYVLVCVCVVLQALQLSASQTSELVDPARVGIKIKHHFARHKNTPSIVLSTKIWGEMQQLETEIAVRRSLADEAALQATVLCL